MERQSSEKVEKNRECEGEIDIAKNSKVGY